MRKNVIAYLLIAVLISCNSNSKQEEYIKQLEEENAKLKSGVEDNKEDTTIGNMSTEGYPEPPKDKKKPTEYELRQYAMIKKVKSYPDFLRKYFTMNSTKMDLLRVQGPPNDIVRPDFNTEVFFYGDCEITLVRGRVNNVAGDGCLKFIDMNTLIFGTDTPAAKIAVMVMQNMK